VPMSNILVAIHDKRANMRASLLEASTSATPSERMRVLRDQHLKENS